MPVLDEYEDEAPHFPEIIYADENGEDVKPTFIVGDRVRVRDDVTEAYHGDYYPGDEGTVVNVRDEVYGNTARVNFDATRDRAPRFNYAVLYRELDRIVTEGQEPGLI